jgi:hypothetical protein
MVLAARMFGFGVKHAQHKPKADIADTPQYGFRPVAGNSMHDAARNQPFQPQTSERRDKQHR